MYNSDKNQSKKKPAFKILNIKYITHYAYKVRPRNLFIVVLFVNTFSKPDYITIILFKNEHLNGILKKGMKEVKVY